MSGGANHSRRTTMTYPNGRVLHFGCSSGTDDAVLRVSFLADDNGGGSAGQHLEEYSYLGLGTIVERARPEVGIDLTYDSGNDTLTGTDGGDRYMGLDRFGRVRPATA